jgi:drug/metabolite transporter (DMT)-like permease
MHWIAQSMIATFCFATIILLLSQLAKFGINTTVINFYFFTFSAVGFLCFGLVVQRASLVFPSRAVVIFAVLGCISVVGNHFAMQAISTAPNPGLVRSVQSMEVVLVTIGGIFLYRAKLEPAHLLGISLMVLGLILITYKNQ